MVNRLFNLVLEKLSKKATGNEKPRFQEVSAEELKKLHQDRHIIRCVVRC